MKKFFLVALLITLPLICLAENTETKNSRSDIEECYPFEDSYIIHSQLGAIKISLPQEWKRLKVPFGKDEPKSTASFIMGSAKESSSYINITIAALKSSPLCDTSEFKKDYLKKLESGFQKQLSSFGFNWLGSEYTEIFNTPVLEFTYLDTNKRVFRETYFIKSCNLYWIEFAAGTRDIFDKELPVVDGFVGSIEFLG